MHSASQARALTRAIGIETSNLYTAFLSATIGLLKDGGQLIAISPRSFCNGPYFRPFRELFLTAIDLRRIHVFQSRQEAFKGDEVLQETIIVSGYKNQRQGKPVEISSSQDAVSPITSRRVPFREVVHADDPQAFIHIRSDNEAEMIAERMACLPCTLSDLRINVSTGRVVDFRAREHLRSDADEQTVPLIYPGHMTQGTVVWPRPTRKPNALHLNAHTQDLTIPSGPYVLTKRFSAKEEPRRVVAAVFDPDLVRAESVGFENHLNYYHRNGAPLDIEVARGLTAYLNTTLVDEYFRQFNGHTQVNATDLRSLRYPSETQLRRIGANISGPIPAQAILDALVGQAIAS